MAVMLRICVQYASLSNHGLDTVLAFPRFSSVLQYKCRNSTSIRPLRLPSKFFPILHSLMTLSFDAVL